MAREAQAADAAAKSTPSAAKPAPSFPAVLPAAAAEPAAPATWSQQEIELAHARCAALLKGLDVVAVPETPLREGIECGTPAPMKLVSIGKSPQVALSPPPTVTCDMIAALHKWMTQDLQPLARKHLGAPIIRIEAMSSYSCRNAYGRARSRLSEHGRANALDIGAFVTARGQTALVMADWGPTGREIAAQAAAAKGATDKGAADKAATQVAGAPDSVKQARTAAAPPTPAQPSVALPPTVRAGVTFSLPGIAVQVPGVHPQGPPVFGMTQLSRLGGPKPVNAQPAALPAPAAGADGRMDFLRTAHRSGCKIFGTVLGPEANAAHRNHFHVDMAERVQHLKICE